MPTSCCKLSRTELLALWTFIWCDVTIIIVFLVWHQEFEQEELYLLCCKLKKPTKHSSLSPNSIANIYNYSHDVSIQGSRQSALLLSSCCIADILDTWTDVTHWPFENSNWLFYSSKTSVVFSLKGHLLTSFFGHPGLSSNSFPSKYPAHLGTSWG